MQGTLGRLGACLDFRLNGRLRSRTKHEIYSTDVLETRHLGILEPRCPCKEGLACANRP
jgi:hypothetical protein